MCQANHSPTGVLPSVGCLNVIMNRRLSGGLGPLGAVAPWGKMNTCGVLQAYLCIRTYTACDVAL